MTYGAIIFFRRDGLISKLIKFFDKGMWSHTAIILGKYKNRILFIESNWSGVELNILNESRNNYEIVELKIKPFISQKAVLSECGKKYDYWHFLGLFVNKITFGIVKPFNAGGYVCSELVNYIYGFKLSRKGYATPNSVYKYIKESNLVRKKD